MRARQGEWSQQFTLFKVSEAALLVDASNAFNSMNRATALANVRSLCPSLAKLLINCYRESSDLYIDGEVIQSQEGTTQGDPLSMPFYVLATIPLIKSLPNTVKQVLYADDGGSVRHLRNWWNELNSIGPSFGYFPNAVKTWLAVKEDQQLEAEALFHGTDINITCSGRPHLGVPLGTQQYKDEFISEKVSEWVAELQTLSTIASTEQHAAYAALTHHLSSRWLYLSRTMSSIDQHLQRLEEVLLEEVLPNLTHRPPPSTSDRDIFALRIRYGGLGIRNPAYQADFEYTTSHAVCTLIINNITSGNCVYDYECECSQMTAKMEMEKQRRNRHALHLNQLGDSLQSEDQRILSLAGEKGASSWLIPLPLQVFGFCLHKRAFFDALALRYGWLPQQLPVNCACGVAFSVEHALSCRKWDIPPLDIMRSVI